MINVSDNEGVTT